MRCNWRRWLWGVIPLVGLGAAAAQIERPAIEKDLTERAQQALAAEGAEWAGVNFSGLDVVLTGNATDEDQPDEAVAVLRGLWGVGEVKDRSRLPPPLAQPYEWIARRRDKRIRLQGHFPDKAMRQTIIGMTTAAMPGFEVADRMRRARGVPPTDTWLAGLSFGLKQLALLKRGRARLEDLALSIEGETEDSKAYQAVIEALKGGLPKGITLASAKIAPPVVSPFTWSAQFAGGQLVLSGHVAGEDARAAVLAAARAATVGTDIVDRMEPARGAPEEWAKAAGALVKEMVRLKSGSAKMSDVGVVVGGLAADEAQAKAVRDGLRKSLPSKFTLTDQIRMPEPEPPAKSAVPAPAGEAVLKSAPPSAPKSAEPPAFQSAQAGPATPPQAADTTAPKTAELPPAQAEDTAAPKAAEAAPAQAEDTAAPKAESAPAETEDTATPKTVEPAPAKTEETAAPKTPVNDADTAAPKTAESAPAQAEDTAAPKAAESAPAKTEDTAAPKAAEAAPAKTEDTAAPKAAESAPAKTEDTAAPKAAEAAPAQAEDTAAPKAAESAPAKTEDASAPKTAESAPAKTADTAAPKVAEAAPAKTEETAAPKVAESAPAKTEDTAAPKVAEAAPAKTEETAAPKVAESAPAKTEETATPKAAESAPAKSQDAAQRAARETALRSTPARAPQPAAETPAAAAVDLAVCRRDLSELAGANPIMFDRGYADIKDAGRAALGRIAAAIKACPGVRVAAQGHADIEGTAEHNQRLSERRAAVVAEFLIEAGVSAERLETVGFGTSRPAVPNTTKRNLAKNRRTEIVVRP